MSFANARTADADPEIFAAILRPSRSLSPRGLKIILAGLALFSLAIGLTFFRLGAWPVPGFLGLDVAAVYAAFRISNGRSRTAEEITVTAGSLRIRRVAANGRATASELNPYWARIQVERSPDFGVTALAVASHGQSHPVGDFLGPGEREALAVELQAALARARACGMR